MNRIDLLFEKKDNGILSIFMTAGYPNLDDTVSIIEALDEAGVDMIEIGIPFSDPIADGPVIQHSSMAALANGMSIDLLMEQLKEIRTKTTLPLILMGYINPVMQFGIEKFCRMAANVGIDGFIIPDLPLIVFEREWKPIIAKHGLHMIFLITPNTSPERIKAIDEASGGFIYMVTAPGTTGGGLKNDADQQQYFERVNSMNLQHPLIAGFGVKNKEDLEVLGHYTSGAIVGSHFVNALSQDGDLKNNVNKCISELRKG